MNMTSDFHCGVCRLKRQDAIGAGLCLSVPKAVVEECTMVHVTTTTAERGTQQASIKNCATWASEHRGSKTIEGG